MTYRAAMVLVRSRTRALTLSALVFLGCKAHPSQDTGVVDAGEPAGAYERIDFGVASTIDAGGASPVAPMIAALGSPTPVFSAAEWPPKDPTKSTDERAGVIRIGSIRKGQSAAVKASILKKANCPEGWFELVSGGYVCGKFATLDMTHKELASAPHAPLTDGPLPYEYGLNITNGTPLYRRAPLRKERKELERALSVGKTAKGDDGAKTTPSEPGGDTPWYTKDHHGQRPQVTFEDLKGETSLIELRMVRGFYLALDKEVHAFSGKFWRTTQGKFVPADHVLVHQPKTEFEGVWVGRSEEPRKLPLGFSLGLYARHFLFSDEGKLKRGDKIPRFSITPLTGQKKDVEGRTYYETSEGWWMRDVDGTVTRPGPPPADLAPDERWIDVNLATQSLVAFEGDKPMFATLVSSGRHDDNDKSKDHRTVMGSFRIREKHISATMDDDGASDGPYSIQDVPWIMYFQGGYALHGAFWHSSFGHERSHGCVNLTPHDAKELFGWVGPELPPGWHSVRATAANPGTRVVVHE
jgi:L,D-transpeptidase catalytic domain